MKTELMNLPIWKDPKTIKNARSRIMNLGKNMHEHAYLVGRDLLWVRDKIGTTAFGHPTKSPENNWITENFWFGLRTAYYFIAFSKKCDHSGGLLEYHPGRQLPESSGVAFNATPGQYSTIIIDPPWPIQKIERYEAPLQGPNLDYKTMTLEAIRDITLPAAPDCHLFLWTTQKFLPEAIQIMAAWEFKYVLTMVWRKAGGFQPVGLPQYNCEFVVYGRKGSPAFVDTKDFFCCFDGKRREHSRKPVEFYDVIRRVTPEPRIDIFSRERLPGFECSGDEVDKF